MIKIALQQKNKRGLTPTRRQFIIWTNDGLFAGAYMRHSASMSKRICFNLWNKYIYGSVLFWLFTFPFLLNYVSSKT